MKLSEIKPNKANPRVIRDEKFRKLKQSIKDFPKMFALRPIVVNPEGVILGGNMRFRVLQDLGYKDIPDEWVKRATELTEVEQRRFVIEDNVSFGEWDFDLLANDWDSTDLDSWGVDIPNFEEPKENRAESSDDKVTLIFKLSAAERSYVRNELSKYGGGLEAALLTLLGWDK